MKKFLALVVDFILVLISLNSAYADSYAYTRLDHANALYTYGTGINDSGTIVGYYYDGDNRHGFILSNQVYTTINYPINASNTYVTGINDSGTIVGWYHTAIGNPETVSQGFTLSGGQYTPLAYTGAADTQVTGINNNGSIVGYYTDLDGTGIHGFSLSGGNYTTLNFPGAVNTWATGINDGGTIVGWYYDGAKDHGFTLSDGNYTTVDYPGAAQTFIRGINDSGTIVGEYTAFTSSGYMRYGFTLSGGNYTTVTYPDATTSTTVFSINDTGTIVGWYYDGTKGHGFQAVPPPIPTPEPASIILFGSGLMGLAWGRRKFQK